MKQPMRRRIFISYRRGDDSDVAARLNNELERIFGLDSTFFDIKTVPPGIDFHAQLEGHLKNCAAFIMVIGLGWLGAVPRLNNLDDLVRIEIEAALARRGILIIPVLVQGAKLPKPSELPISLVPMLQRNALTLTHENFVTVVEAKLATVLRHETEIEVAKAAASHQSLLRNLMDWLGRRRVFWIALAGFLPFLYFFSKWFEKTFEITPVHSKTANEIFLGAVVVYWSVYALISLVITYIVPSIYRVFRR